MWENVLFDAPLSRSPSSARGARVRMTVGLPSIFMPNFPSISLKIFKVRTFQGQQNKVFEILSSVCGS